MRRSALVCSAFVPFILAGCSSRGGPGSYDDPVGQAESPIVFGTKDTTHSAVVAILAADGQGFDECSGSIVHVENGEGYVLTAAHCCGGDPQSPNITPSIVITGNDYAPSENYIGDPNPPVPAYAVVPGSVSWDQAYNGMNHDFCMLRFSGATANTPTIQLPQSADDGLAIGVSVEYVGYGVTVGTGNNDNSLRYHASAPVNQSVTTLVIQYSEGNGVGGPCEGDSGGPALLPAGAAQSAQTVVATTSYGDQTCAQYGVSSRVSSEIGPNGFITNYITNSGSSSSASTGAGGGGQGGTCDTCQETALSQGGGCYNLLQTCGSDVDCANIVNCQNACAANDASCPNTCYSMYPNGQADYDAIVSCICTQSCVSQCASDCGNSGSGGASASSVAATSGTGLTGSTGSTGSTTTGSVNPASGTGSSTGSSINNGNGDSGAGGDDGGGFSNVNQKSSCALAVGGDSAPGSSEALGGILFAAALAMSRRRRAR